MFCSSRKAGEGCFAGVRGGGGAVLLQCVCVGGVGWSCFAAGSVCGYGSSTCVGGGGGVCNQWG